MVLFVGGSAGFVAAVSGDLGCNVVGMVFDRADSCKLLHLFAVDCSGCLMAGCCEVRSSGLCPTTGVMPDLGIGAVGLSWVLFQLCAHMYLA